MAKQPLFQTSLDAQLLAKRLRETTVGETVTYEEMHELIGRDPRQHGLYTALRELLRDRLSFGCISGVGFKRLNDAEIVDKGSTNVKKINRMARRSIRVLAAADYESLPQEKKLKHNTSMTIYALAAASTGHESVKRIEHQVQDANSALPAGKAALAAIAGIDDKKRSPT